MSAILKFVPLLLTDHYYHQRSFCQAKINFTTVKYVYSSSFLSIVHHYTPTKKVNSTPLPSWSPHPLLHKIQKQRRLFNQARQYNTPENWKQFCKVRNSIVTDIRNAKKSFLDSQAISPRPFWSYVRSIKRNKTPIPILKSDSKSAISNQDKANLLNTTFSSFFSANLSNPLLTPPPFEPSDCSKHLLCTPANVCTLTAALPTDTSPGSDGITSFLLKATTYSICLPLAFIFNQSLSTSVFLSSWKHSIITPIPKNLNPFCFSH